MELYIAIRTESATTSDSIRAPIQKHASIAEQIRETMPLKTELFHTYGFLTYASEMDADAAIAVLGNLDNLTIRKSREVYVPAKRRSPTLELPNPDMLMIDDCEFEIVRRIKSNDKRSKFKCLKCNRVIMRASIIKHLLTKIHNKE
jgi:hypothetical protein